MDMNIYHNKPISEDTIYRGVGEYYDPEEITISLLLSQSRFLFTVYDDNYIKEHNIVINCGAKHCVSCGICYKYLHEFKHGLYIINERKK